jgi:hypothetical protein
MTIVIVDALYNLPKRAREPALLTLRQAASTVKNRQETDFATFVFVHNLAQRSHNYTLP